MMIRKLALPALLLGLIAVAACGKKQESGTAAVSSENETGSAAVTAAADANEAGQALADEAAKKKLAVEQALTEQKIVDDPKGQWAAAATASSTYSSDKNPEAKTGYSPLQATGKPDVERYGDMGESWATEKSDAGIEWLEVGFAKPVRASEIRVRQNNAPGAIIKIELIDEAGTRHSAWEGVDETQYPPDTIGWFVRSFEPTTYAVKAARITLASNAVYGWNEIDAVQLIGE